MASTANIGMCGKPMQVYKHPTWIFTAPAFPGLHHFIVWSGFTVAHGRRKAVYFVNYISFQLYHLDTYPRNVTLY